MASPRPASGGGGGGAAGADEAIWRKLREAGFDEESVRRRDKAALIGYITKLESEIYEYQHNLGLLLLERKEWTFKFEQLKASSESAEIMHKRERAAQQSALAEARKREEILKKSLGVQKECVANLEKALHDMRGETAETKVSYETKLAETLQVMEAAQKKFDEAEEKLIAAKSLEAESTRSRNAALRSLQDIEDREDQLRRYRIACELENESKEKEIALQRKSLNDTKKILHEKEQELLKEQTLLDQRDENILERLMHITRTEKRLEEEKLVLEAEQKVLVEEKSNLELKMDAIVSREEAVIQKESLLDKRESELLIFQETIASKERAEIQRLNQEQQTALERRRSEFEAEIENERLSFESEIEVKKTSLDQREAALSERESSILEREQTVDLQLIELANRQEAVAKRSNELEEEKEKFLSYREAQHTELLKEREEIQKMKLDLEKEMSFFEEEKHKAIQAQENLVITQSERNELLILQMTLKEEIDSLRAQKLELMADADRLQGEKERFEIEWELIDEKKELLQKEAVRIAEERRAITEHLKNESDSIKQEKDNLRMQFKNNSEALSRQHEEFMIKMKQEHTCWLSKIQQEREDLKKDIDIQRTELLNSINAKQLEIDSDLRERQQAFEKEKTREHEYIKSQKQMINSQLEHVVLELQKLEDERKVATLERQQREKELSEIKSTIDTLNSQREKLQEQRKLLHSDREAITQQIEHLSVLEELKIDSENKQLSLIQSGKSKLGSTARRKDTDLVPVPSEDQNASPKNYSSPKLLPEKRLDVSPSVSTPIAWVRKCADVIFKRSPGKDAGHDNDRNVQNGVSGKHGKAVEANDSMITLVNSGDKSNGLVFDQLGEGARQAPRANDGVKVGKKRLNNMISHDQSDSLEPRQKHHRRSTRQNKNDGKITSNCPSALEEKCSKNEHDAGPFGLSGSCKEHEYENTGPHNLKTPENLPSSDDVPCLNGNADNSDFFNDEEPSEDITVSVTEPSNGDGLVDKDECDEDADEESEEEEKVTVKEKLWHFLIT